jgi:hypothetical protein
MSVATSYQFSIPNSAVRVQTKTPHQKPDYCLSVASFKNLTIGSLWIHVENEEYDESECTSRVAPRDF